jgi:colanic acid biosynthesis glycosyl transferase WcaI
MRILFVTTYFEPDQGAASIRLTRLVKELASRGHQITVLTTLPHYPQGRIQDGYRGKAVVVENRDGVRVIQSWLWATPSARISRKLISQMSFMVTAAIRGLSIPRPDVIFIEAQPIFTSLAGVWLSLWKRAPYVLNVSDLWPDHLLTVGAMTEKHPIYRIARWVVDQTYKGAARITCASPGWVEAIERYIGANDKTQVIYYGVDLERFRPGLDTAAFREKYILGAGKLVTFIGTFATQYDFEAMMAVARRFASRQDVRFVFIGAGSQSDTMRQQLAQDGLSHVQWLDWVDQSEIPLAWAATDITFWMLRDQALYRGTIPRKLYEAMASGTPIVAAMEGIAAKLLEESGGGVAVPFGDVDGMVKAITQLLEDTDLRVECSRRARAYAEEHFDAGQATVKYERVLSEIARSSTEVIQIT